MEEKMIAMRNLVDQFFRKEIPEEEFIARANALSHSQTTNNSKTGENRLSAKEKLEALLKNESETTIESSKAQDFEVSLQDEQIPEKKLERDFEVPLHDTEIPKEKSKQNPEALLQSLYEIIDNIEAGIDKTKPIQPRKSNLPTKSAERATITEPKVAKAEVDFVPITSSITTTTKKVPTFLQLEEETIDTNENNPEQETIFAMDINPKYRIAPQSPRNNEISSVLDKLSKKSNKDEIGQEVEEALNIIQPERKFSSASDVSETIDRLFGRNNRQR